MHSINSMRRLALGLLFPLMGLSAISQDVIPSMGTTFWLGYMQNYQGMSTQSLDVFISSYTNTSGTVSMPLTGWSQTFNVQPGITTTVTVPMTAMHNTSGVVENKGILIETADTVAVFAINFESYTADGASVFPVQSLGTEYRIFSYQGISNDLTSEMLIVATEDGTSVEITPTTNTVSGQMAGVTYTVDLDAGETYQLKASTTNGDLTGTTVIGTEESGSCRPFAVFSGTICTRVPGSCTACDHIFQQNLPRKSWGTTYYAAPFSSQSSYTYRIMADQDNTVVTRNGANPVTLDAGDFVEVNFQVGPMCFEGNQPFCVAQYMEGSSCVGTGDPALLILNAAEQKIDNITFSTVESNVISNHYVNIIVDAVDAGQVYLNGAPVPPGDFSSFPGCPTSVYAAVNIPEGSHTLSCANGLTAYVYGTGDAESYAYSVGSYTPAPPINLDSVYCGLDMNGNITLSLPEPLFNPFWTTMSAPEDTLHWGPTYTFTPTGSEVFVVTGLENISGCAEEYLISVELDEPLELTLSASSTQVCAYTEIQLDVDVDPPGTYTYNWSPAATLSDNNVAAPIATPSSSGWYKVLVSTISGCSFGTDSIYIDVTDGNILSYDALSEKEALCLNDSSQMEVLVQQLIAGDDLNNGLGVLWDDVANGTVSDVCGSVTGDALYFDGTGPRYAQTVPLDVSAGGTILFSLKVANGTSPCADADFGENILLQYSTNNGVSWVLMGTYFEYLYADLTLIEAEIVAGAQTASTMFRWSQPVNGGAGESNWVLDDVAIGTYSLDGLNIAWQPAAAYDDASSATPMAYPAASGWFSVTIDDPQSGCVYQDSIYIDVGEPFSIALPEDTAICDLAGIQLYATPSSGTGHTWEWTPNNTLSSGFTEDPVATPNSTTEYHVTVTTGQGCVATDSVTITVNQLLGVTITTPDDELCSGETAVLNSTINGNSSSLTYDWSPAQGLNDATAADPVASPEETTNYILTVTDTLSGCVLVDSILIQITNAIHLTVTEDTVMCDPTGLPLNVTHDVVNAVISWTPAAYLIGANTADPVVDHAGSVDYIVQVTDELGCFKRDTVKVTMAFDDLTFFADSSLCEGQTMVIDAGYPGSTYAWSNGADTQTISVDSEGDYTVNITDTLGCQATFTTSVTVDLLPVVDLGPDTSLCVGQQWTMNAGNPGSSYLWNNNATTQSISTTTNGTFWVEVIDQQQCAGRDTIVVTYDPMPFIQLVDQTVCVSQTVTLNAGNPGSTFEWNTGETTQTIAVTAASGIYSVIVTTPGFCVDSAQAELTFVDFPVVELGPDVSLCENDTITLNGGDPADSHTWSNGSTAPSITLTDTHLAWVVVFNGHCTTTDSVMVTFDPLPQLALEDTAVCISQNVVLYAGNPGSSYMWSTGATSQSITVSETGGTFSVTVTTPEGCTDSDQAEVTFVDFPVVDLGPDTSLCDGEAVTFNLGNPGAYHFWSNGSNEQTITITGDQMLWGQVYNGYCTTRDSILIEFHPLPKQLPDHEILCLDQPPYVKVLDAENDGCSYLWSTGATTRTIEVKDYGNYRVRITTPLDCSIEEEIFLEEYCPPAIHMPNAFTPDGDGTNDRFGPIGHNLANVEMSIYDRWGELIFVGKNNDALWDGHVAGRPVPDGVYVWTIRYRYLLDPAGDQSEEYESTGHVTVVR